MPVSRQVGFALCGFQGCEHFNVHEIGPSMSFTGRKCDKPSLTKLACNIYYPMYYYPMYYSPQPLDIISTVVNTFAWKILVPPRGIFRKATMASLDTQTILSDFGGAYNQFEFRANAGTGSGTPFIMCREQGHDLPGI